MPIFSSVKWESGEILPCSMLPEEEKMVAGWGGERGRKEAAPFSPSSDRSPGIRRVEEPIPGQLQGGPASPTLALTCKCL